MATRLCANGPRNFTMSMDERGMRTYKVTFRVESDDPLDGPVTAYNTPGIQPLIYPGNPLLIGNDVDIWVWSRGDVEVTPVNEADGATHWDLTVTYSNQPVSDETGGGTAGGGGGNEPGASEKCSSFQFEDPLLEPAKISVGFTQDTIEPEEDRFGNRIQTRSFEKIRGPNNQWNIGRPYVRIQQNVATAQLYLMSQMIYRTNNAPLWGFDAGQVMLTSVSLDRQFYGLCYCYWTRSLEFEINVEGFSRKVISEGIKVLSGRWPTAKEIAEGADGEVWIREPIKGTVVIDNVDPAPNNPAHYIRYKDHNGDYARVIHSALDLGEPLTSSDPDVDGGEEIEIDFYKRGDLTALGIPVQLETCAG